MLKVCAWFWALGCPCTQGAQYKWELKMNDNALAMENVHDSAARASTESYDLHWCWRPVLGFGNWIVLVLKATEGLCTILGVELYSYSKPVYSYSISIPPGNDDPSKNLMCDAPWSTNPSFDKPPSPYTQHQSSRMFANGWR